MKRRYKKKNRKCGICSKKTENTHLCQVGEDVVYLCPKCYKDPTLDIKRTRLSSLYGFIRANDNNPNWKKPPIRNDRFLDINRR